MKQDSALELQRQNAELSARVATLTRALAQVEAFTSLSAGVVHDLRNAFHVTLLSAEGLGDTLERPEDLELAQTIVSAAEHGAALARDLLLFTRQEDTRTSIVKSAEAVARLQRLIQRFSAEQITCSFEIEPDVWSVQVEQTQLDATLVNLSVNARDAMPRGGELRVRVRNLPQNAPLPVGLSRADYVEFSVSDTGTGMDPSVLAHATEAFFTTKAASGGTGLGLAMADAFAVRSGGALMLESTPRDGTNVKIVLPRAPEPSDTTPRDPVASAKLDTIMKYIRAPELRHALQEWRLACPANGLPRPVAIEARLADQSEHSMVLAVQPGTSAGLRLLRMGRVLERSLGNIDAELGELPIDGWIAAGTLAAAYHRAFESRFPSYEYAKFSFEGDVGGVFERLILPTAADGRNVSHLLGLVRMSNTQSSGGEHDRVQSE